MTVFNFGSINVDLVYRVPHLPGPGETLGAASYSKGLGGKGANQSVAVAKAGRKAVHIGMVGADRMPLDEMAKAGVVTRHVGTDGSVTGHANIYVDDAGENMIVIWPGANHEQSLDLLNTALAGAVEGDLLLLQNETSLIAEAARLGRAAGCRVIYSAAPFDPEMVETMLPLADIVVMNAVEAQQMADHLGTAIAKIEGPELIITRGADGSEWRGDEVLSQKAFPANPVDTTGAGDCFIGYVAAALDEGFDKASALRLGAAASAIQVTRPGASQAVPQRSEVDAMFTQP